MSPAAVPQGAQHQASVTYHEAPEAAQPMACPHCGHTELMLHAMTPCELDVQVYRVGVTRPEYDTVAVRVPEPNPQPAVIERVSCPACRWAFSGPEPLSRLVKAAAQ